MAYPWASASTHPLLAQWVPNPPHSQNLRTIGRYFSTEVLLQGDLPKPNSGSDFKKSRDIFTL
jgi:hypothetical protein